MELRRPRVVHRILASLLSLAACFLGPEDLEASPWVQQHRWMVLGPVENPADCGGDLDRDYFPGYDLGHESPAIGDAWVGDFAWVPGAINRWIPLADLGFPPDDIVDLDAFATDLGLQNDRVLAVAVVYAVNRTDASLPVIVCSSSDDSSKIWVNDRVVTSVSACRGNEADCSETSTAVLLPGTNRLSVMVWEGGGGWQFRLGLRRIDGSPIDDASDPDVAFTLDPEEAVDVNRSLRIVREVEGIDTCPLSGAKPARIVLRGEQAGDPDQVVQVVESVLGQAQPSAISHGGAFTTAPPPAPPCVSGDPRPVGLFEDHRDVGAPCGKGDTVRREDGSYDVTGGGLDIWATGDQFQFAYTRLRGDFSLTAHIAERDWGGPSPPSRWGKFGLMARQDCTSTSRYVFLHDSSPNQGPLGPPGTSADPDPLRLAVRATHGGTDNYEPRFLPPGPGQHPDYLRLERKGDTFTALWSYDGAEWTELTHADLGSSSPCEWMVGLAVTSHADCSTIRIRYDQVVIEGGDSPCPDPPPNGGTIRWNVKAGDLEGSLSYGLEGRGSVHLFGHDGFHGVLGESNVFFREQATVGPELTTALDVGQSFGGSTSYDSSTGVYTQVGSGFDIWTEGDSFQYCYRETTGDFDVIARVVDRQDPTQGRWGKHGLMARQSCSVYARNTFLAEYLGLESDWPALQFRPVHDLANVPNGQLLLDMSPDQRPDYLRMIRKGDSFYGLLSRDGNIWTVMGGHTWTGLEPTEPILVGFVTGPHGSQLTVSPPVVKFRVLHFGELEHPPTPPLPEGAGPGSEVYATSFDDVSGFQTQHNGDGGDPGIAGGRLKLLDEKFLSTAASAFRKEPLEGIDSAIWQFDFDVFLRKDGEGFPADGLTFTVARGDDPSRLGYSGGGLGYQGLGLGASFAVEFDTYKGIDDGIGSPSHPRSYHVGIDYWESISSKAQTAEGVPDIFDPAGIHARVRYNRGHVTVWLASNAAGAPPLKKFLEAEGLPISYLASDEKAVFGFTAATGAATVTAEVDNLVVTRIEPSTGGTWLRCDANGDGSNDLTDAVFVIAGLFLGGPASGCPGSLDCNSDGKVDITDAVFDLAFLFQGGGPPATPYPECDRFAECASQCP